jgi:hypothetical protein
MYPVPSIIALVGWLYIFLTSGWSIALFGVGVLATGVASFTLWRRPRRS